MKAYRVEHLITGVGPYNNQFECDDDCEICESDRHIEETLKYAHTTSDPNHPGWMQWADQTSVHMLAGFQSIEELTVWFRRYLNDLHDQGYVIGVYESDTAMSYYCHSVWNRFDMEYVKQTGQRQLIFAGKRISHLPLTD